MKSSAPLSVDFEMVQKYNKPGPRYTSYPTAPHFADIDRDTLLERLRTDDDVNKPLSLYFHIPFCETLCWFCGCTTVIRRKHDVSRPYIDALEKEMALKRSLISAERPVVQMHWGGGSPTFLNPEEIRDLARLIRSHFTFADDAECGVEIDPRRLTREHIAALSETGFNRASIGVQDNDPRVQEAMHRIQPFKMTAQVVDWIRLEGFRSLNVDLIYGLPHQTPASFEKTLDEILSLSPDRFAVFSYAHVPWIKPGQKILDKFLPTPEIKLELLKLTIEKLTSSGYTYVGMDHFAKFDDELAVAQRAGKLQRNFQGYSTHGGTDIHGYGMSSISQTENVYVQNIKELPEYYRSIDAAQLPLARGYLMTADDRIRRTVIMRLMCDSGLDFPSLSENLGIEFREYFASELGELGDLENDGLIELSSDRLRATDLGRLLIRNVAMKFDAYLSKNQARYSKTV